MIKQVCGDGVTVTQSANSQQPLTDPLKGGNPLIDEGASPVSSLHLPEREPDDYSFRVISKQQAKALIIEHHYKHRPCPISWSYGIESEGEIVGCPTVG